MKSLKKVGASALAIAVLASSTSAFACANDQFIGYDQIPDDGYYAKLYKCPTSNKVVKNGYADKAEWKHAFYEAEYPHREIEVLYLDDVNTEKTRFMGNYADVKTTEKPEFWEAKRPYFVYNRLYSDFTGSFQPTNVLKTDYVKAPVEQDWVNVGFDKYVVKDGKVYDYSHVYGNLQDLNNQINYNWNTLEDAADEYWTAVANNWTEFVNGDAIPYDLNGDDEIIWNDHIIYGDESRDLDEKRKDLKDEELKDLFSYRVDSTSWLELTGPDYATGGVRKVVPVDEIVNAHNAAAAAMREDGTYVPDNAPWNNLDWFDDTIVTNNVATITEGHDNVPVAEIPTNNDELLAKVLKVNYEDKHPKIEWVSDPKYYEQVAPYRRFEILSIDGVLMDGSLVEVAGYNVDKQEVLDTFSYDQYGNQIQMVQKATELIGIDEDVEYSYIVTPFSANGFKTVNTTENRKVIEDWRRENVGVTGLEAMQDDQYEIRFAKVTLQPGTSRLPYIWRYTGACADPVVEWKVAFAEAAAPYEIYEEKFVDGIATGVYRTTGRYAEDTPVLSYSMSQPRVLTVILKDTANVPEIEWVLDNSGYDYIIAGNRVNVIVSGAIYDGHEDLFQVWLQELPGVDTVNVVR